MAFDSITDPANYNIFGALKLPITAGQFVYEKYQQMKNINGALEHNRMTMNYSSANDSEEESSSLINILDRKKYNQHMSANRSAEEQMFPQQR